MSKRRARQNLGPDLHRRAAWIGVLIALLGGALALYANNTTIQIEVGGLQEASACTLGSVIDCDAAHASSYAMLLGVPVAFWGLLFYVVAGLLLAYAATAGDRSRAASAAAAALVLSVFAVGYSLVKAFHLFDLRVVCLVCLGMYAANIGILVASAWTLRASASKLPGFLGTYAKSLTGDTAAQQRQGFAPRPLVYAGLTLGVFALGFLAMRNHIASETNITPEFLDQEVALHFRQQPDQLVLPDDAPVKGNPDGPVQIVEFSDFQCPACKVASGFLRALVYEFDDEVAFSYMHYPLDTSVNDSLARQIHPLAGPAAKAAVCADAQGEFWAYHDGLFEGQERLSPTMMERLARNIGLDQSAFASCLADPATTAKVRADVAYGNRIDVRRTPTVLINGRPVRAWQSAPVLRAIVQEELNRMR